MKIGDKLVNVYVGELKYVIIDIGEINVYMNPEGMSLFFGKYTKAVPKIDLLKYYRELK